MCNLAGREQSLARLEAATALRMLAERMPGLARDGSVQRRNATTIRGPWRVPVTAGPVPARAATAGQRGQVISVATPGPLPVIAHEDPGSSIPPGPASRSC